MVQLTVQSAAGRARAGLLRTPHGEVPTPAFMPCATRATVRGVTPEQLRACGVHMLLANAYHLILRPGPETVAALGGLHRMMAWDGPILTDSGGYQVFSLAPTRSVDDDGVTFQSHVDGSPVRLTPESCVQAQVALGADVIMQLDECPPAGADVATVEQAVQRSADWAGRCRTAWLEARQRDPGNDQSLFGIQQGGTDPDLRRRSAEAIAALDLPGYAVGGLSVGEPRQAMLGVIDQAGGLLPENRPRYLMGVGEPRDILAAVASGFDLFDCVLPTRNGRNAQAFTWAGRIRLRNAAFARDDQPIDPNCPCLTCRTFSRGALRHYFLSDEMLAPTLVTIHNLAFFAQFMGAVRSAVASGQFARRAEQWTEGMYARPQDG